MIQRSLTPVWTPPTSFDVDLGLHRLHFSPGGSTLIVSFDHAGRPAEGAYHAREPWGAAFYLSEGHSLLGVIARQSIWFRDSKLIAYLESLRDEGFFSSFTKVVLTGGSMGGFGAAAFAELAPNCVVIVFSPQATLDPTIVPWERRFRDGQACDWSLPYNKARDGLAHAQEVFIFTDTLDRADLQHAKIMAENHNQWIIPVPGGGHGVQPMLVATGILKKVTQDCISGNFDPAQFFKINRARKTTVRYFRMISREALIRDKPELTLRLCDKAIQRFPASDFREIKSLALARLGRLDEAFGTMLVARKSLISRIKK